MRMTSANSQTPSPTTMPEILKPPKPCPVCDMAALLGLSSSVCEALPSPIEKKKCRTVVTKLETGKSTPVDVLKELIIEHGETPVNESVDRLNIMMNQATKLAEQELRSTGKLDKDGNRLDGKI